MKDKNLLWIGAAAGTTLLAAFGVIAAISSKTDTSSFTSTAPAPEVKPPAPTIIMPAAAVAAQETAPQAETPVAPPPQMVKDEDLQKLATQVDLPGTIAKGPDKAQWAKAIPAAEALATGPCDCQQKVWLKNFVEVGNSVVSGSGNYKDAAKFLASLPKSYNEVMARQQANNP